MLTISRQFCGRAYSQVSKRMFSSRTPQAFNSPKTRNSKFDKSMLKPALVVVLFGSMLTSVMEQQKKNAELERRYAMKIGILKDLITKIQNDESASIDVDHELALVNKLFKRFERSKYVSLEEEAIKIREYNAKADSLSQQEVMKRLNGQKPTDDDASLRDLFRDIMKDMDDESSLQQYQKISSQADHDKAPPKKAVPALPNGTTESEIQTNDELLTKEAQNEKERLKYRPSTEYHVIVETPGEYSSSAEDMKVSKFL
ncbi:LANO_0F17062g1_1 [Lachancea nothofagi CBS 11611]|uniref:LANO_0F17062g1_1 n=1 Tax=Lachancea nothofagi CBS 11611 TaxID=1266666 RepID=A0A1G4KCZ4_9SACH|nr:LANO_0F17062g1_1 [Lachancea nothofagi CBS 11611]